MGCKSCSDVTLLNGTDGNGIQTIVDNGNGTFTIFMTNGTTFTSANLTGPAATVTAGTATGLAAGAAPTVANGGTTSAAVFNFGIPVGATGATGPAGLGILTNRDVTTAGNLSLGSVDKLTMIGNGAADIDTTLAVNTTVSFVAGQTLLLVKSGTGAIRLVPATGVTLNGDTGGAAIFTFTNQWDAALLVQTSTINTWVIMKLS